MKSLTYIDAVCEALHEEMARDEKVFFIGEDVDVDGGVWNEAAGLLEKFGPNRVVGTPISESGYTGLAVGAALAEELRPVVEFMYGDFIHCAMDQVADQVAKARLMFGNQSKMPVVLRLCACGVGTREAAQHSQQLEAWFAHLPGFKVVMPSTPEDGKGLMKSAIRCDEPVVFVECRNVYYKEGPVPEGEYTIPIGKAKLLRPGKDVTLLTYGYACTHSMTAAENLAGEIDAEVIDLRTLKPLDMEMILESVAKTGRVVVAQEAPAACSIGAEVIRRIVDEGFDYLDAPPVLAAGKDVPIPFAEVLEDYATLSVKDIEEALRKANC
ncbi:MAG: alpha-ketoacid dehydrogenase subunit beta [Lentisphaerae bacterium]|nr:alpha-ketoacid dehydrogenase subunit beta [Lentisphaerota bacterium]